MPNRGRLAAHYFLARNPWLLSQLATRKTPQARQPFAML